MSAKTSKLKLQIKDDLHLNKLAYTIILCQSEDGISKILSGLESKKIKRVYQIIEDHIESQAGKLTDMQNKKAADELKKMSFWMRDKVTSKIRKVRAKGREENVNRNVG